MFIAATKLPEGQEATTALVEGVHKDYFGRAVRALDAFDKYAGRATGAATRQR